MPRRPPRVPQVPRPCPEGKERDMYYPKKCLKKCTKDQQRNHFTKKCGKRLDPNLHYSSTNKECGNGQIRNYVTGHCKARENMTTHEINEWNIGRARDAESRRIEREELALSLSERRKPDYERVEGRKTGGNITNISQPTGNLPQVPESFPSVPSPLRQDSPLHTPQASPVVHRLLTPVRPVTPQPVTSGRQAFELLKQEYRELFSRNTSLNIELGIPITRDIAYERATTTAKLQSRIRELRENNVDLEIATLEKHLEDDDKKVELELEDLRVLQSQLVIHMKREIENIESNPRYLMENRDHVLHVIDTFRSSLQ